MSGNRLIAKDLVSGYPTFKIQDVTLTLSSGDKMALVGKGGRGKSTLINTFLSIKDSITGGVWFEDHGEAQPPFSSQRPCMMESPKNIRFIYINERRRESFDNYR